MSNGEESEDKKLAETADQVDDNSLDDVFEVDETFDVEGDFEVNSEAAGALQALGDKDRSAADGGLSGGALDSTLTDSIRLADELVKMRIEKIHEAGEKSVSQAVESMEALVSSVLDATEAATRASAAANSSTSNLVKTAGRLTQTSDRSARISTIVLSVGGAMLFISVAVFGFMAAQLSARTGELESMVMAVGKRVVEMNVSLNEFTTITDSIDQLRITQETFRDGTYQLTERINVLGEIVQLVQTEVPAMTAESVGRQSEVFTARVSDVESLIQSQKKVTEDMAKSVEGLAGQLGALRKQIANVSDLNKDVKMLVTLQKQNYLEVLQPKDSKAKLPERTVEPNDKVIIRYPNPEAALPLPEKAN